MNLRATERLAAGVREIVGRIAACRVCLWPADVYVVRSGHHFCERHARGFRYIVDSRDDEPSGMSLRLMQVRS